MGSTRLVSNDGTGRLRHTGTLPDRASALTIGAWFQSPTVPASRFATLLAPFGAGGNDVDLLYISDNYGGGAPVYGVYCGPSLDTFDSSGLAATTAWFHYSVAYSSGGATCRIIRDVSGTLTVVATWSINREAWAATGLDIFNNVYGGLNETAVADTQVAYCRIYPATLDATALLAEAGSTSPLVTVYADWPLQNGVLTDASGNGRTLATSGSITLGNGTSSPPAVDPPSGSTESRSGSSSLTFATSAGAASIAAASGSAAVAFTASGVVDAGSSVGTSSLTFAASAVGAAVAAVSGASSLTFAATGTVPSTTGPNAVAVYRIDEAASGSSVTTLTDASGNGLDLTVNYVSGDPVFVTGTYGRGFDFNRTSPFGSPGAGAQRLITSIDAVYSSFSGARQFVIEAVAEIPNMGAGDEFGPAPIAGIFREDGENDPIGLWWWNRKMIVDVTGQAGFDGGGYTAFTFDYINAARSDGTLTPGVHVFHAVFDSTATNAADRLRLYVDGVRQSSSGNTGEGPGDHVVDLNDSIMIPLAGSGLSRQGDHYLCVGGFKDYGFGLSGSWEGAIYWVRLGNVAPSDSDITARTALLATDWDLQETYLTIASASGSASVAFTAAATAAARAEASSTVAAAFSTAATAVATAAGSGSAAVTFDVSGVGDGLSPGSAGGSSSVVFLADATSAATASTLASSEVLFAAAAAAMVFAAVSGTASMAFAASGTGTDTSVVQAPSPRFFLRLDHRPKDLIMGIDSRENRLLGTRSKVAAERFSLTVAIDVPAGDSVSSVDSVVATGSGGVTIGTGGYAPTRSGNRVTFWVEGGTPSTSGATAFSTIRVTVSTASGRTLVGDVKINVLA